MSSIRSTRAIAAVFTQPSTHVSVQLKSADATLSPARPSDVDVVKRWTDAFVDETSPLGYPEELIRALLWFDPRFDPTDLVALTFIPAAAIRSRALGRR